jgi:hypothetical protein
MTTPLVGAKRAHLLKEGIVGRLTLALVVCHGLIAASPAVAQPTEQWGPVVGNWNVYLSGNDRKPLATGIFAFHGAPQQGRAGGLLSQTAGPQKPYVCGGRFQGGKVELQCDTYGFLKHFNYQTLHPSADRSAMSGTWSETPNGKPDGIARWTRARPAIIDRVEVFSGAGTEPADYAVIKQTWAEPRELIQLRIRVHGRDLPIWLGGARPDVLAWQEISIDDPTFRIVRETSPSTDDLIARWRQRYLDVVVALESGTRPGLKTISVNGTRKTFEVRFRNFQEASKVVELKFVRKDGSELKEIGYGEPFHVEARFDIPPPEAERTVKLDWGGGARDIPVVKQKDTKLFRSGLLFLEAPTSSGTSPNR